MDMFKKLPEFGRRQTEPDYDCRDGAVMKKFGKTSFFAYDYYCLMLAGKFERYDSRKLEENYLNIYRADGFNIFCQYNECEKTVRIICDPNTVLPEIKADENIERKCTTSLFQFETDHSLIDCGMCYFIRCCDGSFFVIDSAHMYSVHDEERLHSWLRKLTPEGENIVISGWFFSHGHQDHINKALDYFKYCCGDTYIECLYYNFISSEHRDSGEWDESTRVSLDNFCNFVDDFGMKHVKLHSGQHFAVRNLEFDVLCTHEDVYPGSVADFNDSSTVLMMTAEGTKVCFPGDAFRLESDITVNRYPQTLKCDIMQLSHHGHTGCRKNFYELAQPKVLLAPNSRIMFDAEYDRREENRYCLGIVDECYVSSEGTVEIPLPYKKGQTVVYPDETTENFEGIYNLWCYEYTDEFKENVRNGFIGRGGIIK